MSDNKEAVVQYFLAVGCIILESHRVPVGLNVTLMGHRTRSLVTLCNEMPLN
jgi:hypothetical protein